MTDGIPVFRVTFHPAGRTVRISHQETLLQAALHAGLVIPAPCGAGGSCGYCRVKILSGHVSGARSAHRLSREEMDEGWRLACCTRVDSDAAVFIPEFSEKENHATLHVLAEGQTPDVVPHHPAEDLAGLLGIAFDLGTTTLAASLVELDTGLVCDSLSIPNPHLDFGDSIAHRVAAFRRDPALLPAFQQSLLQALTALTDEICGICGVSPDFIHRVAFAGNPAMQQLLAGFDLSPLIEVPFIPAFLESQAWRASDLGLHCAPSAEVISLPQLNGRLGGDVLAGMLACGLDRMEEPALFVDLGTTGKIALAANGNIFAGLADAEAVFSGSRIRNGMPCAAGAIEHVYTENNRLMISVAGGGDAKGLCGTALIDAVAELLNLGMLAPDGTLLSFDALPADLSPEVRVRVLHLPEEGTAFELAENVCLFQEDIHEYQRAAALIRCGIEALLAAAKIEANDLRHVFLAGSFGLYIRRDSVVRTGLLPDIPLERIRFTGNASLTGARMALLSHHARQRAEALRRKTQVMTFAAKADDVSSCCFPG